MDAYRQTENTHTHTHTYIYIYIRGKNDQIGIFKKIISEKNSLQRRKVSTKNCL